MKRVLLVALVVLGSALAATAEDGSSPLPFTPWANAKVGDYSVVAVGSETRTARVVAVASGSVTVERDGKKEVVSTAQPPSVASFFHRWERARITAWRVIDDSIDLGGLEVACQRLTFTVRAKGEHAAVTVWFSPDVKGSGVAIVKVRQFAPAERTSEERVVEFGSAAGPAWKRDGH